MFYLPLFIVSANDGRARAENREGVALGKLRVEKDLWESRKEEE
jgi:hypothetical protein